MGFKVDYNNDFDQIAKDLHKGLTRSMEDIVLDVERVSSEAAPHKTGYLEKTYEHKNTITADGITSEIAYKAEYAERMHDGNYKPGEGTSRKPGGRSKYGNKTIKPGRKFLDRTVEENAKGYMEYLEETVDELLDKYTK